MRISEKHGRKIWMKILLCVQVVKMKVNEKDPKSCLEEEISESKTVGKGT